MEDLQRFGGDGSGVSQEVRFGKVEPVEDPKDLE